MKYSCRARLLSAIGGGAVSFDLLGCGHGGSGRSVAHCSRPAYTCAPDQGIPDGHPRDPAQRARQLQPRADVRSGDRRRALPANSCPGWPAPSCTSDRARTAARAWRCSGPACASASRPATRSSGRTFMTLQLVEDRSGCSQGRWNFTPIGDAGTRVELEMRFEFANPVVGAAVRQVVRAELRHADRRLHRPRARQLHGAA